MNESWLSDLLGVRRLRTDLEGGTTYPERATLLLKGAITVVDDPAEQATVVTIGGGSSEAPQTVALYRARVATTAPVPLSGLIDVDAVGLVEDDVVLVRAQDDPVENGIYRAHEIGWERFAEADQAAELVAGSLVIVREGETHADQVFILTTNDPVPGTTPLDFQLVGSGDAQSLRGKLLATLLDEPEAGDVLVFDGAEWTRARLTDAHIAELAAIQVDKLKAGTAGQVLRTTGGKAVWGTLSTGDVGEVVVTAAGVTGIQDNYAPTGWSGATVVRLVVSGGGGLTIRGLGPAAVRRKLLINTSGVPIDFVADHVAQEPGNKLLMPRPIRLGIGMSVLAVYDPVVGYWWLVDAAPPPEEASIPTDFPAPVTMQQTLQVIGTLTAPTYAFPPDHVTTALLPLDRRVVEELEDGTIVDDGWMLLDDGRLRCWEPLKTRRLRFRLPPGATLASLRIGAKQHGEETAEPLKARVEQFDLHLDAEPPTYPGRTLVGGLDLVLEGGGDRADYHRLFALNFNTLPPAPLGHVFELSITSSDNAGQGVSPASFGSEWIYWAEISFVDPAASNYAL